MQIVWEIWNKLPDYVVQFGVPIVYALLIFVIGKRVAKFLCSLVEMALKKAKVDETLAAFAKNIAYYIVMLFVCIAALNKIGIDTNSFVALLGAAGLAIGFALQGSLANFAAGVMIILFQTFRVGDTIETTGVQGVVHEIQMFNTILDAPDGKRIIIPNAKITSDKVIVSIKPKA
ncbi:MAG: mechanosensitive ion channel domain-containing protein [Negativicutes bacterium]|jgi:small conductance mechanosensitive channel